MLDYCVSSILRAHIPFEHRVQFELHGMVWFVIADSEGRPVLVPNWTMKVKRETEESKDGRSKLLSDYNQKLQHCQKLLRELPEALCRSQTELSTEAEKSAQSVHDDEGTFCV